MIGLINKIKSNLELKIEKEDMINNELNQVEQLSNYTIFLVHDIIDYYNNNSKLKELDFTKIKIDILELIYFCKGILETLLIAKGKEKNIKVDIIIDKQIEDSSIFIISDPFRIKQILLNFISNSSKFTGSGFTQIKTDVKNYDFLDDKTSNINLPFDSDGNLHLKISIIDSGIGINNIDIQNIFEERKNLSKKEYNLEGSGLGLSIAKNIADSLEHKLYVKSVINKGSEFSLIMKCYKNKK